MAQTVKNDFAKGLKQMPTPFGAEVVSVRLEISIPLSSADYDVADIANSDIWFLGFLPANCVPVDFVLDADDLEKDAGNELTLSVGLLNDPVAPTDISGTAWMVESNAGQTGTIERPSTATMSRVAATGADRAFGIKVVADPEVDQTTGGPFVVGVTLSYRAAYAAA